MQRTLAHPRARAHLCLDLLEHHGEEHELGKPEVATNQKRNKGT